MLPRSVALKKRIKENGQKHKGETKVKAACLFPQSFVPNPGAQERFFTEFFSTDQYTPHPFTKEIGRRVAWYRAGLNCVAGDTLINGISIKDLTESPIKVKTLIGELWATPAFKKGTAQIYKVRTQSGKEIRVTEGHRFLSPVHPFWKQLKDLSIGDFVGVHDISCDHRDCENTKDLQDGCFEDFRHDDERFHPFQAFFLDKLEQLYKPVLNQQQTEPLFRDHNSIRFSSLKRPYCVGACELTQDLPHTDGQVQSYLALLSTFQRYRPLGETESFECSQKGWSYPPQQGTFEWRSAPTFLSSPFESRSFECCQSFYKLRPTGDIFQYQHFFPLLENYQILRQNPKAFSNTAYKECPSTERQRTNSCYSIPTNQQYLENNIYSAQSFATLRASLCNYTSEGLINASWDRIISVEKDGFEDFYDLHVPIANHYFANGFINHNSGKSFAGAAFAASCALKDPDARGLITANSYGQLKNSSLTALAEFCRFFRVPLSPVADIDIDAPEWADLTAKRIADNRFCTIFGAPVLVLSAESFTGRTDKSQEVGRGLQVRWFWGDEYAYANESAFNTMYSRLGRGPGTMPGTGFLTSSINRNNPYNWAYDLFDAPNREKGSVDYFVSVGGSSAENLHADPEYVKSMMATLTPELIKIELLGEYATVAKGIIFNTFVRAIHLLQGADARLCEYDPRYPLHLSFDFNHSPACAIAAQQVDGELRVLREWYKVDSDTFELADDVAGWVIAEWTAAHNANQKVFIHGDASGNQKTANSRTTNWEIVWDALKSRGILGERCYGASNPDIQDSVNGLKIALKNDKIFLHSIRCLELSKDLESLRWRGTDIDKRDLKRSHVQDCLRYLCWDLWPYLPSAAKQAMRGSKRNIRGVVA